MILNNLPQQFRIGFQTGFFYKEVSDRWSPIVKRMKLPYESVEDFMNAQIQSVDFPGINLEITAQQQGQMEVSYPTGKELEPTMAGKTLNIKFKLTESYLPFWIIYDQIHAYLKYSKDNHKPCFMDPIVLTFLNNTGFALITFQFKDIVPESLSGLPLSYAAQAASFNTVDWGLKYTHYTIENS